jgi:putative endonuclease
MLREPRAPSLDRRALGAAAEDAAAAFLENQGLRILLRNFRCRFGELDVVALQAPDLLILGEVRLRGRSSFGDGAASVDIHKQRRLRLAARHLLARRPALSRLRARFDVFDVRPAASPSTFEIRWIRDAF